MLFVIVTTVWWLGWMLLAQFSLTGINTPSTTATGLILLMLLFLNIGARVGKYFTPACSQYRAMDKGAFDRVHYLILALVTPIILFYFVRATNYLYLNGFQNYRMLVFGTKDAPSVLFGSGPVELLYYLSVYPLLLYSLFYSGIQFFRGRYLFFAWTFILLLLDAIMRMGRFNLYFVLFIFLLLSLHFKRWKSLLIIGVIMMSGVVAIGQFRDGDRGEQGVYERSKKFLVEYHTVGIAIFDQELRDSNSYLQQNRSYGRAMFGGVEQIVGLVARKLGFKDYSSYAQEIAYNMQFARVVGYNKHNDPLYYNAFSTMLYSMYLDARGWGFVVFPFLLGFAVALFYGGGHLLLATILSWAICFSLFQSQFESAVTWIVLFMASVYEYYCSKREGRRSPHAAASSGSSSFNAK
ncbi:MAG: oligosaccharide repeat unit polymerase [Oligoflexia bacterium]|nr:oligosaccharide repeat unit polymerase [Oligoflexia bacterium]